MIDEHLRIAPVAQFAWIDPSLLDQSWNLDENARPDASYRRLVLFGSAAAVDLYLDYRVSAGHSIQLVSDHYSAESFIARRVDGGFDQFIQTLEQSEWSPHSLGELEQPPQPAPPTPAEDDPVAKLTKFKQMRDAGLITEADYAAAKAKVLGL